MIASVLCEAEDNTEDDSPERARHISSDPMLNEGSKQCGSSLLGCQSSSERLELAPLVVNSGTGAGAAVTVQDAIADRVCPDRTKLTTVALTNIYMVGTQGETSVQQVLATINANGSPMSIVAW